MNHDELKILIDQGVLQRDPDKALVQKELQSLVDRGFIRELPNHFFEFDNNLTWEVVYETLLYAERRRLHALVAQHIELQNRDHLDGVADVLAHHYEKSQNINKCVWYSALAGKRAEEMYANEDALSSFNKALELSDLSSDVLASDKGILNEKIADVYVTVGKYSNAVECYGKSLELEKNNQSTRKSKLLPWKYRASIRESELSNKIAVSFERQSMYEKSIEWSNKAESALPSRPGDIAARIFATRSVALFRMGEYEQAIKYGKKSLTQAKRLNRKKDVAYAHNMLANSYIDMGNLKIAIRHLGEAVKLYSDEEYYPGMASANSNMGSCYMLLGKLDNAEEHFKLSINADERLQNLSSLAMDHNNLGETLVAKGSIEEAKQHLNYVVSRFKEKICPPDLTGLALINLSRCEIISGNYEKAEQYSREGLLLIESVGQSWLREEAEIQLVEVMYYQSKYARAEELCRKVLESVEKQGMKLLKSRGLRVLGSILNDTNRFDDALEAVSESVQLAQFIGAEQEEAKSIVSMEKIKLSNSASSEETVNNLQRAIYMFESMGARFDLADAERLRASM